MFKRLCLLAALLTLPVQAMAQTCGTRDLIAELGADDRARLDALVAPHPYPTGNLWRATRGDSTVTVVGTIHVPDPRLSAIVERLDETVANADLLILEATAEDEAGLATLATEKPEMFFITEGPTLIDILGDEEWAKVNERLAAMGIPGFLAAKFQPWYLSMTLAIPPCALSAIQSGAKGLDRQLEVIANEAGVPLAALDDTEAVLRLFADEPIEDQLDGLRITLETQADGDAASSTLIEAYFDGRIRESWEFGRIQVEQAGIENGAELFEEVNQSLLIGRNEDWEPKMNALLDGKENVVIAVGAAHLSGESGVLMALKRAGYTLAPLSR
ncbi:MAG: TraB/GumN family protein [Silicimonas sp.]|nr:TraB/GumN family protein [Silicimonas sp.]